MSDKEITYPLKSKLRPGWGVCPKPTPSVPAGTIVYRLQDKWPPLCYRLVENPWGDNFDVEVDSRAKWTTEVVRSFGGVETPDASLMQYRQALSGSPDYYPSNNRRYLKIYCVVDYHAMRQTFNLVIPGNTTFDIYIETWGDWFSPFWQTNPNDYFIQKFGLLDEFGTFWGHQYIQDWNPYPTKINEAGFESGGVFTPVLTNFLFAKLVFLTETPYYTQRITRNSSNEITLQAKNYLTGATNYPDWTDIITSATPFPEGEDLNLFYSIQIHGQYTLPYEWVGCDNLAAFEAPTPYI